MPAPPSSAVTSSSVGDRRPAVGIDNLTIANGSMASSLSLVIGQRIGVVGVIMGTVHPYQYVAVPKQAAAVRVTRLSTRASKASICIDPPLAHTHIIPSTRAHDHTETNRHTETNGHAETNRHAETKSTALKARKSAGQPMSVEPSRSQISQPQNRTLRSHTLPPPVFPSQRPNGNVTHISRHG